MWGSCQKHVRLFFFLYLKTEIRFIGKSFKANFVMGQPRAPHVKKGEGELGGVKWVVGESFILEILKLKCIF